jgi:hypothetical protein
MSLPVTSTALTVADAGAMWTAGPAATSVAARTAPPSAQRAVAYLVQNRTVKSPPAFAATTAYFAPSARSQGTSGFPDRRITVSEGELDDLSGA